MKVLYLSPNAFIGELPEFTKNKNGFSLMVGDIVKSMAKKEEVYLLTYAITKECELQNVRVVRHTWLQIFRATSVKYVFEGIKNSLRFKVPVKNRLRYLYYSINKGAVKTIIKTIAPDIINIHGIGYATKPFIEICEELDVKYVVTLHGLIGIDESVRATKHDKEYEKQFLIESEKKNILISVISSGIKRRILEHYCLEHGNNIKVILNGTGIKKDVQCSNNVIERHEIPPDKSVLLCIGNITDNKNQIQVVRAYNLLKKEIKDKVVVLFLGNEVDGGKVRAEIKRMGCEENLILCGFVERKEMSSYLECSMLNLFPSLNDGFGLPIIECFMYGVPTLAFSDLDAVIDVYKEECMMLVEKRDDALFAEKMEKALQKKWDKKVIESYGKKFSIEEMTRQYQKLYYGEIG